MWYEVSKTADISRRHHQVPPRKMTASDERAQKYTLITCHCTQIWIVLLIGHAAREICFNQSGALPISEKCF